MAVVTWGLLEKSLVDDETIEEAINRLIQAHDDDETAHLETGQSLQSHKASEIIDHIARSIVPDKLRFRIFSVSPTTDGFNQSVTSGNSIIGGLFWTEFRIQSLDDENLCLLFSDLDLLGSDWDNDEIYFETVAKATSGGGYKVKYKVGIGEAGIYNYEGIEESFPGIGFFFNCDTKKIYAYYVNSANQIVAEEIVSSFSFVYYKLGIELIGGVLKFYLNDTLVWTPASPTFGSVPKNTSVIFAGSDYRYDTKGGTVLFALRYLSYSQPSPF